MTPGPGIARTPLPKGFYTGGVNCGIRKYRHDLGIIVSDIPANTAGVFTQNELKAAPVVYCQKNLPSESVRAIITNSGQANAATGNRGTEDNLSMVQAVADELGCPKEQIMSASTGVIGVPLEIDKIVESIPRLLDEITDVAEPFAVAILTTDLVPKTVSTEVHLKGGSVRITGICKGSGMIHPNMATMLGYLLTDADIALPQVHSFLKAATDLSFNCISVDGDMSTNDCNFLMANGVSGVSLKDSEDEAVFLKALTEISQILAKSIARDGEGATRLIDVTVSGASSDPFARQLARSLVKSPLVKTAIHGEDPNWGRILSTLGAEKVSMNELENMTLKIQDTLLFEKGSPVEFCKETLSGFMKKDNVRIEVQFQNGSSGFGQAWGCDLSKKYVEINAEYTT